MRPRRPIGIGRAGPVPRLLREKPEPSEEVIVTTSGQATLSQPEQPAAIGASRGGLDALFAPRSIVLVGASDDAARIGGRPLTYLRASGFSGPVYPVNPKRETVQGEPAYASLSALPEAPDLPCWPSRPRLRGRRWKIAWRQA